MPKDKKMNPMDIANLMVGAAKKKSMKEGSPAEEASESPMEAKAEGDANKPLKQKRAIAINEAKKGQKVPASK